MNKSSGMRCVCSACGRMLSANKNGHPRKHKMRVEPDIGDGYISDDDCPGAAEPASHIYGKEAHRG